MQVDPKIKLPTPLKIQNKLNELHALNIFTNDKEYLYGSNDSIKNMFFIYLFRKYKNKCFVRDKNNLKDSGFGMSINVFESQRTKLAKETNAETLLHLNVLADELVNCIKNRNIEISIIPVTVHGFTESHANILIYRKKFNHIEHFEPHGQHFGNNRDGTILLKNMHLVKMLNYFVLKVNEKLKTTKETEIKLVESTKVCPRIAGLQRIEGSSTLPMLRGEVGYCQGWSLFFAELCLINPEIPSSELLTYIFNILDSMGEIEQANYLRNVIRGYAVMMNEKLEKYFSILYDNNTSVIHNTKYFTKLNIDTKHVVNALIGVEINLIADPNYVDRAIRRLQNDMRIISDPNADLKMKSAIDLVRVQRELEFFKMYKQFDGMGLSSPKQVVPLPVEPLPQSQQVVVPLPVVSLPQVVVPLPVVPLPQSSKPCPEGKEINPKTGRCIQIKTQKAIAPSKTKTKTNACPEGKEINPKTGRCIKIKTQKAIAPPKAKTKTNACPEGKEINPKTGRCIKTRKA
jgi:hypothetical protein